MIHPGPPTIRPGMCPGGVVIHVYAATDPPVLLLTRCYRSGDPIEKSAERDANATADTEAVCLVAYDGDTGDRYSAIDWAEHE
jgi:hypothetical protein